MKTLRSLVSGEDADLQAARDRFRTLVAREEGIVRNAILVGVTEVNANIQSAHTDGQNGVAELKNDIKTTHTDVTNALTVLSSNTNTILANTKSNIAAANRIGHGLNSVLVEMNQASSDRKGRMMGPVRCLPCLEC